MNQEESLPVYQSKIYRGVATVHDIVTDARARKDVV